MPPPAPFSLRRKYRLVTRSDFDGLVCAALLKQRRLLNDIRFVHPKDIQDGRIELFDTDITTNLPYRPEVALSIDHHSSETERVSGGAPNRVIIPDADSAARVVYDHLGAAARFPDVSRDLLDAVDRTDAARLTFDDVLYPSGWILLSFLTDPRTGLGRFRDFRISNDQLMLQLIDSCLASPIEDLLSSPDVAERIELYREHSDFAAEQLLRCSRVHSKVVVLDPRNEPVIHPTNRFLLYAIHPDCTVSIHVLSDPEHHNTTLAVGRSIFDRSSRLDLGSLMLAHGGGGHAAAGTCQVDNDQVEATVNELVTTIVAAEERVAPLAPASTGLPETLEDALAALV